MDLKTLTSSFDRVWIHRRSAESEVARRFFEIFPKEKIEVVDQKPLPENYGHLSSSEFSQSKRQIYVCEHEGQFFKRCPGSRPGLTCCNYFVLNLGLQCNMNCSYCYLQSFLNTPWLTVYSNIGQALTELQALGDPKLSFRVGTGEVIDSLSLDPLTLYSQRLISFFRDFPNWKLEFKTKSDLVDQFLDTPHAGNIIVSWSLNPQVVIDHEEHGTASLQQRLSAARRCLDKGFRIAFHIDPIIWHKEWEVSYGSLVDVITSQFEPKDLTNISLGSLRFQPDQRHMMRERFGFSSWINQGEMFQGADGKLRYDQQLRQTMYKFMLDRFKAGGRNWNIFLCMETPETWLSAFDHGPKGEKHLDPLFDYKPIRAFNKNAAIEKASAKNASQPASMTPASHL